MFEMVLKCSTLQKDKFMTENSCTPLSYWL